MLSTILQSDLCSLNHFKRYGHAAIPLSGDMNYGVGYEGLVLSAHGHLPLRGSWQGLLPVGLDGS